VDIDEAMAQVYFAGDKVPMTPSSPPMSPAASERSSLLTSAAISDWLQQAISSLQVSQGTASNREVRFDIRSEILPGVRVVLQESNGRVQVDFICSVEASRHLVSEIAQREVSEMARRCRRDLVLRVRAEDEDPDGDPALRPPAIEVWGIA
jgi:hypothetical protein